MAGVESDLDREVDNQSKILFYLAFHPYHTLIAVLAIAGGFGVLLDRPVVSAVIGVTVGGPVVWVAAVYYVNSNYQSVLDAFIDEAILEAKHLFGGAGERPQTYEFLRSYDAVNLVEPERYHEPILMIASESSLLIYEDALLELDRLRSSFGSNTVEIFYDSINSVNYDAPHFEIHLDDGDYLIYQTTGRPDELLRELQQRIREFKQR